MHTFFKSVGLGSLAGGFIPGCFIALFGFAAFPNDASGIEGLLLATWASLIPFLVSSAFVIVASAVVGLPLTAFLVKFRRESWFAYVSVATVVGFLIPLCFFWTKMSVEVGVLFGLIGAFSGVVTANSWWRGREALVWDREQSFLEEALANGG